MPSSNPWLIGQQRGGQVLAGSGVRIYGCPASYVGSSSRKSLASLPFTSQKAQDFSVKICEQFGPNSMRNGDLTQT
jgi:hypothetical protein